MPLSDFAQAEQLLLQIGFYGWPEALQWCREEGWSDEKIILVLDYLKREGFVDVEAPSP